MLTPDLITTSCGPNALTLDEKSAKRNNGLELLRLGAALSVLYGHLVLSATFATDLASYVGQVRLPLIPKDTHFLWTFGSVYGLLTGGNVTIVGVAIFFLITGWLTPDMMKRHKRKAYLINRFFRIMPLLVFATLLSALIIFLGGGTTPITFSGVMGTATTTYREIKTPVILPTVWTLAIEIKFYLIFFAVGKWNDIKLLYASSICLVVYFFCVHIGGGALILAHDLHYILFIFTGIALRFAFDYKRFIPAIFTLSFFNLSRLHYALAEIHPIQTFGISNQAAALAVLIICLYYSDRISTSIRSLANLTYSLYLLHLIPGFALIYLLRSTMPVPVMICLVVATIFIISYFSYNYIERPFMTFGKILVRRLSPGVIIPAVSSSPET